MASLRWLQVNALMHVHLPLGPTARYRMSNLVLGKDIRVSGGLCAMPLRFL
jgi:hypothetical protein